MKIKGKIYSGAATKTLVIPRGDENIVFILGATLDYDKFNELCPAPKPPNIVKPDNSSHPDFDDKDYIEKAREYGTKRFHYMIVSAFSFTPDLEFDTVNINDPATWANVETELKEAGFTLSEISLMLNNIIDINGLDQEKIEKATKDFLATQAAAQG